jgi:hypothetical protein
MAKRDKKAPETESKAAGVLIIAGNDSPLNNLLRSKKRPALNLDRKAEGSES